jgi:hypothetical protein
MLYTSVVEELKNNKERRRSGDVIAIPWSLPRLSTVLPGIEQGRYNLVSASPKAGKTQLADFLYVYQPIEWLIKHPESKITLKIFYFSLEVSKKTKTRAAICYKLFTDHGIVVSPQKLNSIFGSYILDDKIEQIVNGEEFISWFNKFENIVTFYDTVRSPNHIYHVIKSYAEHPSNGSYTYKTISWQNEDGTYSPVEVKDKYIATRPHEYVIVILDHIGLLQTATGETLHQAISKYSSEYCLIMRENLEISKLLCIFVLNFNTKWIEKLLKKS